MTHGTTTKDHSHVTKELSRAKTRNIQIEAPSGEPSGATTTMLTDNPISNTRYHPVTDPDALKQGRK